MRKVHMGIYTKLLLMTVIAGFLGVGTVMAVSPQSPNYEIAEPEFGAGAALETCAGQYCAQASIGDVSTGKGSAPESRADFGDAPSSDDPLLEVIVEEGESNLGILTTDKTATKTTTIKVRSYLSDGYTMHVMGEPPRYGAHTLDTPSTPTASSQGSEQFGINVVANTSPEIGADPVQVPSGEMSFGYVTSNYVTPNLFMYGSGDVIARSDSESGQTDYTISMIVNVADSTPAGHFATDFSAVVIPVF